MAEPERPDRSLRRAAALASLRSSFCGKAGDEVRSIVCGPTPAVAICDECVDLCGDIIREQLAGPASDEPPAAA